VAARSTVTARSTEFLIDNVPAAAWPGPTWPSSSGSGLTENKHLIAELLTELVAGRSLGARSEQPERVDAASTATHICRQVTGKSLDLKELRDILTLPVSGFFQTFWYQ
jgi:hypothetical protein